MTPDEKKAIKKAIKSLSSAAGNNAAPSEKTIAREEVLEDLIKDMLEGRDKEIAKLRRIVSTLKGELQESSYETVEMIALRQAYYAKMNALYREYTDREKERELKEMEATRNYEDNMKRLKAEALLRIADA